MGKIIYPKWLEKGDTIGVVAPSAGKTEKTDIIRMENGKKTLENMGYHVEFGENVFTDDGKGRSADSTKRAAEFMGMYDRNDVTYIVSASGGDFLCEMMPYVNFEIIKSNPKWYQGYSDNTHVTFSVTTKTDIATIYGDNFGSYGMSDWHEAVRNNMDIVTGKNIVQNSFKYCHDTFHKYETGYESFFEDKEVYYKGFKNGSEVDELTLRGRIIGGCTDVIYDMAGTTYEDFKGFALRHKEEGILLYLESFVANSETTVRELWKFREMGWFEHVNGILFGRPTFEGSDYGVSYEEAVKTVLGPLGIPYVTGCDIGHKSPQFTIVNGAMAEFRLKDHKGSIRFDYI